MLKGSNFFKIGIGCAIFMGITQATPLNLTYVGGATQHNTTWQDISSVSAVWNDANSNGVLETGEKVTFTVTMHKYELGTHDYDALKVWIDKTPINPPASTIYTNTAKWDFTGTSDAVVNLYNSYSFEYTFNQAGTIDFTASVMCSRDLSGLSDGQFDDVPTSSDWNAWTEMIHATTQRGCNGVALQGEDERYSLKVPEPSSFSLIALGLMGLGGAVVMRRKKK